MKYLFHVIFKQQRKFCKIQYHSKKFISENIYLQLSISNINFSPALHKALENF